MCCYAKVYEKNSLAYLYVKEAPGPFENVESTVMLDVRITEFALFM